MEIKNVQVLKPFGPLVMMAQLPEGVIKTLNGIVDVIKDKKDRIFRVFNPFYKQSNF